MDAEHRDRFFPYRWDRRSATALAVVGARPRRDGVILTAAHLMASLGPFRIITELCNVHGAHTTGPYRWWTAIGPRRSFVDDGVTFGTNADAGVCIHFTRPVPSALGPHGHSALTVTVADLDGLVAELERRGDCAAAQPGPTPAPQTPTDR